MELCPKSILIKQKYKKSTKTKLCNFFATKKGSGRMFFKNKMIIFF